MPKKPRERFAPLVNRYGCRKILKDFGDDFGRKIASLQGLNLSHHGFAGWRLRKRCRAWLCSNKHHQTSAHVFGETCPNLACYIVQNIGGYVLQLFVSCDQSVTAQRFNQSVNRRCLLSHVSFLERYFITNRNSRRRPHLSRVK